MNINLRYASLELKLTQDSCLHHSVLFYYLNKHFCGAFGNHEIHQLFHQFRLLFMGCCVMFTCVDVEQQHYILYYLSLQILFVLCIKALICPSRGLVPLHNACSYGHYEVTELLLKVHTHTHTHSA